MKRLVSLDTSQGKNRKEAAELILKAAKERGLDGKIMVDEKGIPNVVIEGKGSGKTLLLVTHYDVVPAGGNWDFDPFKPFVKDGKLFGRGAADDKAAIVAALDAMAEVEGKVFPILVVVGGEETGESEAFMKSLQGDIALILDSGPYPSIGASGVLKYTIKVKGKQCHSAYPFLGRNAVWDMARLLIMLEEFAKFAEEKFVSQYRAPEHYDRIPVRAAATVVKAGSAWNIIPGEAEVAFSIRTVPGWENDILNQLFQELLSEFCQKSGIEVDITRDFEMKPWVSEGEHVEKFVKILQEVTGKKMEPVVELGGTDGVHFVDRMPVIQFGPMRPENNIHGINEFVYITDIQLVEDVVKKVLEVGL